VKEAREPRHETWHESFTRIGLEPNQAKAMKMKAWSIAVMLRKLVVQFFLYLILFPLTQISEEVDDRGLVFRDGIAR
jgi:hypothetical protein